MKKICYVVSIPLTIESFFIPQIQYLAEHDFEVSVVCSYSDTLQDKLGEKVKYHPIDIPRGISINGSIKAINALTKFFQKENFDLVQYSTPNAAFYSSIASKRARVKIRNYHLMGFRYLGACGIGRIILKAIEKISCKNSTSIECVSKSNIEIGVNNKIFKRDKATVVWNGSTGGVDLKRFDISKREEYRKVIREKLGLKKDDFVFGFVGRITRDKGVNEILQAFSEINDAKLMMIGNPEGVDTLNRDLYKQSLRDKNIIYTGSVLDIEKYYAAMDILLFPSHREGFGNVVIEAAAMGTPAIISNIPGPIDAVVPNKTAFLVDVKDSNTLKLAMLKAMKEKVLKMGQDAREFVVNNFDSDYLCKKILERKLLLFYDHEYLRK